MTEQTIQDGWISVAERLPDPLVIVLLQEVETQEEPARHLCGYLLKESVGNDLEPYWKWVDPRPVRQQSGYTSHITHWMPWPDPPKKRRGYCCPHCNKLVAPTWHNFMTLSFLHELECPHCGKRAKVETKLVKGDDEND